jgi:hypothetical protein
MALSDCRFINPKIFHILKCLRSVYWVELHFMDILDNILSCSSKNRLYSVLHLIWAKTIV